MLNQFLKLIISSSLLLGFFGLVNSAVLTRAASVSAGVLDIDYAGAPGPLFSVTNIAPGYSETKSLIVTNTGSVPHSFSVAISGDLGTLADVLTLEPKVLGTVVWSKTIAQIAKNPASDVIIGSIAPGGSANVDLTAKLATSVGNDFQGKSTMAFSFVVGNESTDQLEPPDNPSPPPAINLGQNLITTLSPNKQTSSGASVATTENQNTAGISGDNSNQGTSIDHGTAKGAETTVKTLCFWWLVLLIALIIFLFLYNYFSKNREIPFKWLWPVLVAVGLYFLQNYFDQFYLPTVLCNYFWLLEILVLVIYYVLEFHPRFNKGKS